MYVVPEGIEFLPGVVAKTSEQPYQAAKFIAALQRSNVLGLSANGFHAKGLARKIAEQSPELVRPDWQSRKIEVMRACVALKFGKTERLAGLLADTGERELIEGSLRNDTFWGVSPTGNGHNWLGHILMDVRGVLHAGDSLEPRRLLEPTGGHRAPSEVLTEVLLPLSA